MAGPGGAATVVIAQPDDAARELLARVVEAAGHIAVRLDASAPPDVVEATVEASANLLIVDLASVSQRELTAVIEALTVRRFPAPVVALTDGPASGALAVAAGAAQYLARPFHQRELTTILAALLDPAPEKKTTSAQAVQPDAEASLLSAIDNLPFVDELPDLPFVDGDRSADDEADDVAAPGDHNDLSADAVPRDPEATTGPAQPAPENASGSGADSEPDGPDETEPTATAPEPVPAPSSVRPTAAEDTFTDILKMGRQL